MAIAEPGVSQTFDLEKPYIQEVYVPNPEVVNITPRRPKIAPRATFYPIKGYDPCSCVSGAKYALGIPQSEVWGNANQIKSNSVLPLTRSLILLNEGELGHVGVILNATEDHITFEEYNAIPCQKSVRQVPRNYPLIRGFKSI